MKYIVTFKNKKTGNVSGEIIVDRTNDDDRPLQSLGLEALQKMKAARQNLPSPITNSWSYSELTSNNK